MRPALDGVRVLEWSTGIAGPHAGQLLGSLGAEVIKIEERERGDPFRGVMKVAGLIPVEGPDGRSLYFESFNFNKKSVALDLKHPEAYLIVDRLVRSSDVFLTNFREEVAVRLGVDYPTLRQSNPRLVYVRVSGFGPRGPDAGDAAYDLVAQARSGAMAVMRSAEETPSTTWGIADEMGAICAAYGVVTALLVRERQGLGQEIDTSLLGGMLHLMGVHLSLKHFTGSEFDPFDRLQAGNPLLNVYRAGDGKWLCLAMGSLADKYWPRLCQALSLGRIEHDRRFDSMPHREENRRELITVLDDAFSQRSRDAWLEDFKRWDLVATPVNSLSEVSTDPQALANEYIVDYDHPVVGPVKVQGHPVQFSATPSRVSSPAPELGQHTEEVLSAAGYSSEEIARFKEGKIIS